MAQGNTEIDPRHVLQTHLHVHMYHSYLHIVTPTTANRKSTKRRHTPPHIGTAMIIMMVMLSASVLVTVGVPTRVTWTAAVVEDIGKTPMSKTEYNCFTSSGDIII